MEPRVRRFGRRLCPIAALAFAPSASLLSEGAAEHALRPNFVLIVADDLGWADLSSQGSRYYETPNLDRLASEGMRFASAYAACAVCSPTRAALLTGRYPARIGVTDWIRARFQRGAIRAPEANPAEYVGDPSRKLLCPPNPYRMEREEVTIAEALKPLGYATCHVGKWHLGDEAWYPDRQGFDRNVGGCDYGQPPSYFDPYRSPALPEGIPNLEPRRKGEYLTDREADEAARFIRENRSRPFFLYLAHYAVHTPLQAKADVVAKYARKPKAGQSHPTYAAMVESVDDAAGAVLAALEEAGVAGRTLVAFTSDNGGLLGSTNNAPLRSGKGYPYEGGIRVPLLVRWPGRIPPGSVSAEPVSSIDWFPTILEAAGAGLPEGREIDGVSLLEHLESGGAKPLPRRSLFWHFPHYRGPDVAPYSIVRSGGWKLIRWYEGPTVELFHLADDPSESRNLAASLPDRVRELDAELAAHLEAVGARLPRPNPAYRVEGRGAPVPPGPGGGRDRGRRPSRMRAPLLRKATATKTDRTTE